MSFTHARDDIGVLYVRGADATAFVDGLSTNLIPTEPGRAVQTAFTDRAAKIIAAAVVLQCLTQVHEVHLNHGRAHGAHREFHRAARRDSGRTL